MSPKKPGRDRVTGTEMAQGPSTRTRRRSRDINSVDFATSAQASASVQPTGMRTENDGSDDEMEWEEVDVQAPGTHLQTPIEVQIAPVAGPSTPIEVSIGRQKRSEEDVRKRAAANAERGYRMEAHKLHTLALLASGRLRNRWLNDPLLQARLLSLTPLHLQNAFAAITKRNQPDVIRRGRMFETAIGRLSAWWASMFEIEAGKGIRSRTWDELQASSGGSVSGRNGKRRGSAVLRDDDPIRSTKSLMKHALMMKGSRDISAQLFTALIRALGVPARLVTSLQSVPWQSVKKPSSASPSPQSARQRSVTTPADSDNDGFATSTSESVRSATTIAKGKGNVIRNQPKPSIQSELGSLPDPAELSDFPVYWVEVFSRPDQRWLPVDPVRDLVNAKRKFEPDNADRRNRMVYVVAFEEDGFARDVTARYTRQFGARVMKARPPSRPGSDWWEEVMLYLTRPYRLHRDDIEDAELHTNQSAEGMPSSVAAFKNHPLYALERHLRREETIHPRNQVGTFRGEPVFPRRSVVALKTAENWMRQGRKVKEGENALKSVKQRAVTLEKRRAQEMAELEGEEVTQGLYAKWQTEVFVPDPVIEGKVPKNAFGNIDLYVPSMLPPGGVHLPYKGIAKVAKKLGFDYAEAVVGFEFRKRRALPILEGIVVAKENEEPLLEAFWETAHIAEEQERIKRRERALKRWVRLVQGLRIRQRLRTQYSTDRSKVSEDNMQEEGEEGKAEAGGFLTSIADIIQPYQLPKAISYGSADITDWTQNPEGFGGEEEWKGQGLRTGVDDPSSSVGSDDEPLDAEIETLGEPSIREDFPPLKTVAQLAAEEMHSSHTLRNGSSANTAKVGDNTATFSTSLKKSKPAGRTESSSKQRSRNSVELPEAPTHSAEIRARRSTKVLPPPPSSRTLRPRKHKTEDVIRAETQMEDAVRRAAEETSDGED